MLIMTDVKKEKQHKGRQALNVVGEIIGAVFEAIWWVLTCPFRLIGVLCTLD
ncbi:hypothetical protein RVBP21_2530 [Pseudomonas phage BRkr]|nr:hypothetical protein RVBP21_2530 [Pseudomonas phage BRkr]